ncbi:hypothetical protein H5410_000543 [Solanum commersonii]|uniref:Leucine-rich repeat-containing N-terminal plant-type domain-containing protein n=1 Tax=Solanum commersonii TaxID=4109 RepID=A0A9J6AX24_SOLCO|nr:hypothetical protein H5410_000543 [Solanum commersonii]
MGNGNLALFLLYAFLCQLAISSSLSHLCPKDQSHVLLQFKHMLTISPNAPGYRFDITDHLIQSYPKTLSWNKSTDCCSWDGVHCDEMTGQVIELNLPFSKLQGKFHSNSSLFQLSNLKRLDLSYNNISGSYISPKCELSSLIHLDLLDSSFTGLIPDEISRLSKLQVLRIHSDPYGLRFGPHNFTLLLKNLTQLRVLDLSYVSISSTIPLNFSSYLTTLQLWNTQLYGILPGRVFHLSNLESLYLEDNPQLTVKFPTTKWNSSASLMELDLYRVNFIGKIPESFSHLTSLRRLTITSCNLSGSIPKPLWNLTNIETLDLCYNHLEGPISDFFRFGKLWWLSLGKNNFDGWLEVLFFNKSWTQLKRLDFSSNSLTGPIPSNNKSADCCSWDGVKCDEMTGQVIQLDLSHSQLRGEFHSNSSLFKLSNLTRLDLSENDFFGSLISPKFGELSSLTHLDLSYSSFTGLSDTQIYGILPKGVFHLSNLESLDLSGNPQLTVRFPTTKWNSSASLMKLYLSGVNATGRIPESFGHLTLLRRLRIASCNLSGSIPKPLWNLTNIEVLDLGYNHLEGPISDFFRFRKIRSLSLRNNNFNGQLEFLSFNRWTQLGLLDCSVNSLTGPIPSNDCGGDDGVAQTTNPVELDEEEGRDSSMISWQAVLMGYGCGLVIGLSIIYIMLTQYPAWFSRMDVELEHKILTRMKKQKKRQ